MHTYIDILTHICLYLVSPVLFESTGMSELPVTWNLESFFKSSLPKSFVPRQGIYDSVHGWPWRHTDKWISIEEVESAWFQMFGGKNLPEDAIPRARFDVAKFQEMSPDLPFPCSETNCSTFHSNRHGFCHKHRFHRFARKLCSGLVKTLGWLELVLLLTIQAAAEIQSRILLLLVLVSLLPVTCIFLEESTGMSRASICITFLVVIIGTCLYTAKRLDDMQQSVFNMALATEARYFKVLQPTSETSDNLVQVSTILRNHSDGSSQEVLQTEQDLKSSYQEAKRLMSTFQTVVCEPLASTGLEVSAKIKSLAELDEVEGGADILFCEVWCDNLQEVQDAWDILKDLDGVDIISARDFFAIASSKKCLQVVVSVQGYLTTVVLKEKSLSSWEAQKGLSDAADSLGLLDKTKASAWETSRRQRDSEVPSCVIVATTFLRLLALGSCYMIGSQIGGDFFNGPDPVFGLYQYLDECGPGSFESYQYQQCGNRLRRLAMNLPFLTCFLILLWEMQCCCCCCCCCCCFCFCKRRQSFKIRPRPTQLWYRKYLGVQGCHYAFKVAALQFLTVMTQGLAKASLFRTIQDTHGSEALRASTAVHCFILILLCNILFPAMILMMPNYVFSRVGAALLDAVLDVGYMVTSIWVYVVFATTGSLTDIFLNSFLNYMSIYVCVAHVLCVCRSLETADWIALFQVPRAAPAFRAWKRMILSSAYALALLAFVGIPLGGIVLGAFSDSSHGLCPPCECSAVAPTSLLLKRCVIPAGYVAQSAPDMEFNLTNRNITEVLPDAFIARGEHQRVRSVSLRGNHLTELPEGLFRDLLQQEEYDRSLEPDIHALDLADNRIATLPQTLFQAGSSGESTVIRDLHLEGNCLTTLPPGVFHGLTFDDDGTLDISHNQLQVLHAGAFHGLRIGYGHGILDISQNKLQELHANAFHGLTFGYDSILDMSQNKLQVLHAEAFHGLTFGWKGILDISQNKLQELHANAFHGLTFGYDSILDMSQNQLQVLHADAFQNLTFGGRSILDMSNNQLQVLHADAFHGLTFGYDSILDMSQNKLQVLHAEAFHGLTFDWKGILDMSQNKLQVLHAEAFRGLTFGRKGILDMSHNHLQVLHADAFHGLTFGDYGILNISHNQLQELHANAFHGLTFDDDGTLDMSQNQLQVLHAEAFHGLTFGWKGILDISQNKLQELHANAFHGLTFGYDSILDMSQNQLQVLHANALQNLTFPENGILDMSENKLQELPPKVFDSLELGRLYLQNNNLIQLDAETFQGLTFGYDGTLDMSQNQLQVLPPKVFDGLELDRLYLQNNDLSQLHAESFQGLHFDENGILDMSQNKLQELPPKVFNGLKLDRLYLRNNNLIQLHAETFQGLSFPWCSNCILDMSQNQLQVLHAEAFHGLMFDYEGTLNISHNKLQELPPKVFHGTGLRILDLAENELVTLPSDAFYGLSSLRRLRLEGNRLPSLGDRPFYSLSRLEELNLERNLLTDLDEDVFECDDHYHWYFGYHSLKRHLLELKLGGNRLTALPDGLFNGFRKLRTLQLQSNQLKRLPRQLFQTLGVEIQRLCSSPMYFAVVSL